MISDLIFFVTLLLWAVFLHELGHILAYRFVVGRMPYIRISLPEKQKSIIIGKTWTYICMGRRRRNFCYLAGIILGALPILYVIPTLSLGQTVICALSYAWSCKHDVRNLHRIV